MPDRWFPPGCRIPVPSKGFGCATPATSPTRAAATGCPTEHSRLEAGVAARRRELGACLVEHGLATVSISSILPVFRSRDLLRTGSGRQDLRVYVRVLDADDREALKDQDIDVPDIITNADLTAQAQASVPNELTVKRVLAVAGGSASTSTWRNSASPSVATSRSACARRRTATSAGSSTPNWASRTGTAGGRTFHGDRRRGGSDARRGEQVRRFAQRTGGQEVAAAVRQGWHADGARGRACPARPARRFGSRLAS